MRKKELVIGAPSDDASFMASSTSLLAPPLLVRSRPTSLAAASSSLAAAATVTIAITCGPRDNRSPIQRGRTLSSEAISAIQSLKRTAAANSGELPKELPFLRRLLKADLIAAMTELNRQGHPHLSLRLLSLARSEPWYKPDPSLYAEVISALHRVSADESGNFIDALVDELVADGGFAAPAADLFKVARLVRVLIASGRGKAAAISYLAMKSGGCDCDEYLFRVFIRGLRRLGEEDAAADVERDFKAWEERTFMVPGERRNC